MSTTSAERVQTAGAGPSGRATVLTPQRNNIRYWSGRMWPVARISPWKPKCSRSARTWVKARPSFDFGSSTATSDSRGSRSAISSGCVAGSRARPSGALRPSSGSARSRASDRIAGASGSGASSATVTQSSAARRPSSSNGIERLLERREADAAIGVDEALAHGAMRNIGAEDGLHRIGDGIVGEAGADQLADRGVVGRRAAEGDLVALGTALIDAEDADMADMVMAAGVDAAGDVDEALADVELPVEAGEALGDHLRDRDAAGRRQGAVVHPRACAFL